MFDEIPISTIKLPEGRYTYDIFSLYFIHKLYSVKQLNVIHLHVD